MPTQPVAVPWVGSDHGIEWFSTIDTAKARCQDLPAAGVQGSNLLLRSRCFMTGEAPTQTAILGNFRESSSEVSTEGRQGPSLKRLDSRLGTADYLRGPLG